MKLLDLQRDPRAFREALLIDTDSGPRPLGECMDPWQRSDFEALDSGWMRAAGQTVEGVCRSRGWLERGRGHSKSADLGIMAAWALFASRRRLFGVAAAGDQDQARLLRDAIGRLLYINPWLASILEVQAYRVINARTESSLEILSSDAPTSYGLTPDFIICDEVVHWKKRDLWDSLISSAAKRAACMLVVITNAGLSDDWQWFTREAVRTDPKWYFSRLDGPVASWITPDRLAEQQRLLPSIAFRRLWMNEWTSGGGDALSAEVIDAAFVPELHPLSSALSGWEYVGGLDLGVSRDASAVCILGVRRGQYEHGRIRLAFTRIWKPARGKKIDLTQIEDTLLDLNQRFRLKALDFDPWEARHMSQRLSATGLAVAQKQIRKHHMTRRVPMVEVPPTGQNLQRIATVLIEAFNDRRLELYEDADLHRDLNRLRVEERPYGFRLVSPHDEHGHGDMGSAFALAMLAAAELAGKKKIRIGVLPFSSSEVDSEQSDNTAFERESRAFRLRAAAYENEMRTHSDDNDDTRELFAKMMQMLRPTH